MPFDAWREKLDAYADGELSSADAAAFSAHLRTCTECTSATLERMQMKRSVAVAGKRFEPSAQFRAKIAASIATKPRRAPSRFWTFAAVPAFASLIIVGAITFYIKQQSAQQQRTYGELADLHVATLASASPVDVVSTDRHTVKPWFQGKIPFAFNLPELQGTEFTLLGGRVSYFEQTPGAQLIYQLRKHEISVFIFQDRAGTGSSAEKSAQELSFNTTSWTRNGLRYFIIGDVGPNDIAALAKLLQDAK